VVFLAVGRFAAAVFFSAAVLFAAVVFVGPLAGSVNA
jgi:hypothetical protein